MVNSHIVRSPVIKVLHQNRLSESSPDGFCMISHRSREVAKYIFIGLFEGLKKNDGGVLLGYFYLEMHTF